MAPLLTALGAGSSPDVAFDRVVDTALGVARGVVVAAVTFAQQEAVGADSASGNMIRTS